MQFQPKPFKPGMWARLSGMQVCMHSTCCLSFLWLTWCSLFCTSVRLSALLPSFERKGTILPVLLAPWPGKAALSQKNSKTVYWTVSHFVHVAFLQWFAQVLFHISNSSFGVRKKQSGICLSIFAVSYSYLWPLEHGCLVNSPPVFL